MSGVAMRLHLFRAHRDWSHGPGRILRVLGPTWSASPVRRLVQSVCLVTFLILFFYVCWPYGSRQYAEAFRAREIVDTELFLMLDPLVSLSTAIAAGMLVWSLPVAGVVIFACVLFPRAFCGYVCPLGTLFDVFDWLVGRRTAFFRPGREGAWANTRYYLLAAVLVGAVFGVLLSGFVAAMPVLTRALLFVLAPVQTGLLKGWYLVPPGNIGNMVSIALIVLTFGLGFFERRFWCSYVCPTGALFSICNVFRLTERRVSGACVRCGQCAKACSFAAINHDFSTRFLNCTFCQTCGGVCPAGAIEFTSRWGHKADVQNVASISREAVFSRRGILAGLGSAAVAGAGASLAVGRTSAMQGGDPPIRPPGSVPEDRFLQLCVRCGQCIKVCPNNVLQLAGFEHGCNSLWTPKVVADWSGCEPSCNNCGQVCPTGAVRALSLEEKRAARIGLAVVHQDSCPPYTGRGACQLCVDECRIAGYDAIEFVRVGSQVDNKGELIEGSGRLAPVVREDKCVGCGLCQMRCHAINVKANGRLRHSAIQVVAGEGREDRVMTGSYVALREGRDRQRRKERKTGNAENTAGDEYLPEFLK